MVRAKGRMGLLLGYSADSRATVHTPKRVFVRFHFTPNYLVYTHVHTEGKAPAKERKREMQNEGQGEREREDRRDIVA